MTINDVYYCFSFKSPCSRVFVRLFVVSRAINTHTKQHKALKSLEKVTVIKIAKYLRREASRCDAAFAATMQHQSLIADLCKLQH